MSATDESGMSRRKLLGIAMSAGAALRVELPIGGTVRRVADRASPALPVNMISDGLALTPREYSDRLAELAGRPLAADSYSLGGVVEELERAMAKLLGKERAVFLPTGTLANQLALRVLAGPGSRVAVQQESHLYNDTGDSAQVLNQLVLLPLGADQASFGLPELEAAIARTGSGRVANRIAAIAVESPVRRKAHAQFDPTELARIVAFAKREKIGLHLDGARLLIQSARTGMAPATYAAPFDTVYVSLYKGLNAASGAMLAGPARLLDSMYHTRRMFGGGLPHVWPFAAVALAELDGVVDRIGTAFRVADQFFPLLAARTRLRLRSVPNATSGFLLDLHGVDAGKLRTRLATVGVTIAEASAAATELRGNVNESWGRTTAADLVERFERALA